MKQKHWKIMAFAAVAALCLTGCKGGDNSTDNTAQAEVQDTVAVAPQPKTPGKYPQGSERMLTEEDLKGMTAEELKIMRNEIFARHGFKFKTDAMKSYFATQDWYTPQYDDVNSMLSDIEKANIPVIQAQEAGGEDAIIKAAEGRHFSSSFRSLADKAVYYIEYGLYDLGYCSDCEITHVKANKVTMTGSSTATVRVTLTLKGPDYTQHENTTFKMIRSGSKWYINDVGNDRAMLKKAISSGGYY